MTLKIFNFFNNRVIHRFQQQLSLYLRAVHDNPDKRTVFVTDLQGILLIFFVLTDIAFVLYCIYLMRSPSTWNQGCLLLLVDVLETASTHFQIKGACTRDQFGFIYPAVWVRYLCFGLTFFILLNLYENM